jgi:LuxR family transcriptional regulator, maltose regulon positive regulatory protein
MPGHDRLLKPRHEPVRFTPAEARVLPFLASYLTLEGIADRLGVRRSTVKTHVVSIYKKLGATTRTQAVQLAEAGGFLNGTGDGS